MAVERKMSGKQPVGGSFDLDAFVGGADPGAAGDPDKAKPKGQGARKPIPEQVTERIQVKLTPTELAKLKEQAGLAPISAFVRKFLQDGGLI